VIEQEPLPSGVQRNKLAQFRTQSVGHGDSRAKTDTSAERLQRLGAILGNGDWQALREWRLSQLAALGFIEIEPMPEPERKPSRKNGSRLRGNKGKRSER
jgi:hypothetical protein